MRDAVTTFLRRYSLFTGTVSVQDCVGGVYVGLLV